MLASNAYSAFEELHDFNTTAILLCIELRIL